MARVQGAQVAKSGYSGGMVADGYWKRSGMTVAIKNVTDIKSHICI